MLPTILSLSTLTKPSKLNSTRTLTTKRIMAYQSTIDTSSNRIIMGADHGGYPLSIQLRDYIVSKGFQVHYVGVQEDGVAVDYPDVAGEVCEQIVNGEFSRGILMCGTGIGISIAANKIPGIRSALVHDHYTAKMCRLHNDANVLALGGRNTGIEVAKEIIDVYLNESYDGIEKHGDRILKIHELEKPKVD
eukprot:TRINITY_DN12283_c0_g1_i1.p1 TRINITY_DN12283_c0_g1~~TRINITY_DN12283_c0_g1_i1.p1  ORF type:complete len:206 (-),score=44.38 TRINITY_DN12283_c0_g1_i1:30-602(-)